MNQKCVFRSINSTVFRRDDCYYNYNRQSLPKPIIIIKGKRINMWREKL